LRRAVHRLISSSIFRLIVGSSQYDVSRFLVGHYTNGKTAVSLGDNVARSTGLPLANKRQIKAQAS
jgi:hypothetical protein